MSMFRRITDKFYVAPQLSEADISDAKAEGFEIVIMNRPAHETPDQPNTELLVNAFQDEDMAFYHIPIIAPPEANDIEATVSVMKESDGKKILAFCRSGTRSATLWAYAMAWKNAYDVETILEMALAAGYDLSPHRARLKSIASG